jgi:hypothetical protein
MIPSMQLAWTPLRQGDAGELSAMTWLSQAGALVAKPLFENPDYDLLAKYAGYEVQPGEPLQARPPPAPGRQVQPPKLINGR